MSWNIEKQGLLSACVDWFQGLALAVPYMNYEIEQLGFDPDTYWQDIAETFLRVTSSRQPNKALFDAIEAL